jgi:hypothetical protein
VLQWPLFWRLTPVTVYIPCAIAQQAWRTRWPESYFRNRHLVLLWNRCAHKLADLPIAMQPTNASPVQHLYHSDRTRFTSKSSTAHFGSTWHYATQSGWAH